VVGFYINLPIGGIAAVILAIIHIPDAKNKEAFSLALVRKVIPELDLIGFLIFSPASIMFLMALQFGSGDTFAWNSPTIIGLFVGAGLMCIIFVLWERRMGDRAMIPGSLLKQRIVLVSALYGLCIVCCMVTASNWIPTYFQAVRGDTPTLSGVHVLPGILSQLLCVVTSGALSTFKADRFILVTKQAQCQRWDTTSPGLWAAPWSWLLATDLSRRSNQRRLSRAGSVSRSSWALDADWGCKPFVDP
jgi:MFS family permease